MTHPLKAIARNCLLLVFCAAIYGCASTDSVKNSGFDSPTKADESDDSKRAKIRLELAVNYYQQKQGKTALEEVNNALASDPKLSDAHVLKGLILMEAGQVAPADDSFKQALRLAPNDPDANNTYGWFLCQTSRESQSFTFFTKAAATPFYGTPAKPLQNAGICAGQLKNYALAESYLLRAQEQDKSLLSVQFHLAQLYLKMKDAPRATLYAKRLLLAFKPTAETLWLAIRAAHLSRDLIAKNRLAELLKAQYISSLEWAAFQRNAFEE
jgi:type IV pilus assembly protein PilF